MLYVALLEQQSCFSPIYKKQTNKYNQNIHNWIIKTNKTLTLNKLFMALELLGLFLGTSNCFLMGEFSFNNGTLGIISLVLFLKLHP